MLACKDSHSTVAVPSGEFLLNPVRLSGPCAGPITFSVTGVLKAPDKTFLDIPEWIVLEDLQGITVTGNGVLDGQGAYAWSVNPCKVDPNCELKVGGPGHWPLAFWKPEELKCKNEPEKCGMGIIVRELANSLHKGTTNGLRDQNGCGMVVQPELVIDQSLTVQQLHAKIRGNHQLKSQTVRILKHWLGAPRDELVLRFEAAGNKSSRCKDMEGQELEL
nr:exopolygalacturonase-like [Ipomoea batatas]